MLMVNSKHDLFEKGKKKHLDLPDCHQWRFPLQKTSSTSYIASALAALELLLKVPLRLAHSPMLAMIIIWVVQF
jgi:hypothetical protein